MKSKSEPEIKPSVYLKSKDLPQIKDWEVGNKYTLLMRVKQTSLSENEYEGRKEMSASFEILDVKPKTQSKSVKEELSETKKEGKQGPAAKLMGGH